MKHFLDREDVSITYNDKGNPIPVFKNGKWDIPNEHLRFIYTKASKIAAKSFEAITKENLFVEGVLAYIRGLSRYDPTQNDNYMGYIHRRIVGSMQDYIGKQSIYGAVTVRPKQRDFVPLKDLTPTIETVDVARITVGRQQKLALEEQVILDNFFKRVIADLRKVLSDIELFVLIDYFIYNEKTTFIGKKTGLKRKEVLEVIEEASKEVKEVLDKYLLSDETDLDDIVKLVWKVYD